MARHKNKGHRYSAEEKAAAVRMERTVREDLGLSQGTTTRVAEQVGFCVESLRAWVRQVDIDEGANAGATTDDQARMRELEQEVPGLKRTNESLKHAALFFGAELDRPHNAVQFINQNKGDIVAGRRLRVVRICKVLQVGLMHVEVTSTWLVSTGLEG